VAALLPTTKRKAGYYNDPGKLNYMYSLTLLSLPLYILDDVADSDASIPVTCGSFVKVTHQVTKTDLNSEAKQLGGGSGQQIVTFVNDASTHNTLWWVRPAHHHQEREYPVMDPDHDADHYLNTDIDDAQTCQLGMPIPCNSLIRLTHSDTLKNLHSHDYTSPLSNQQEVSAYGTGDGNGDGGDNWIVQCQGTNKEFWIVDEPVRLKHRDTGKYLGAAAAATFNKETCGRNCPIMDHLEAFCRTSVDKFSLLSVTQGIHLSK
jgi:dolichyl-phosphate-mannose--protein O-mannosyl transferase